MTSEEMYNKVRELVSSEKVSDIVDIALSRSTMGNQLSHAKNSVANKATDEFKNNGDWDSLQKWVEWISTGVGNAVALSVEANKRMWNNEIYEFAVNAQLDPARYGNHTDADYLEELYYALHQ
jgi:ribosomal protein L28